MNKIILTEEKETLLVPLFGKAIENKKKEPILIDKKAVEIINQINYDFKSQIYFQLLKKLTGYWFVELINF